MRVHHAAADAPAVNITINGENFLENLDYQVSSGLATVEEGEYSVGVDAILPDESTATVLGPLDLELEADVRYDVFALTPGEYFVTVTLADTKDAAIDPEFRLRLLDDAAANTIG